jgi:hypothetical protein
MDDRIADPWGERTPYGSGESWPVRVDVQLADGVREADVDRWAQSASILHSTGTNQALLDGLLREIIRRGWYDEQYVAAHTIGFDEPGQQPAPGARHDRPGGRRHLPDERAADRAEHPRDRADGDLPGLRNWGQIGPDGVRANRPG